MAWGRTLIVMVHCLAYQIYKTLLLFYDGGFGADEIESEDVWCCDKDRALGF